MTSAIVVESQVAEVMVTCPKVHGPECGVEKLKAFFEDEHVHMALIVTPGRRLLTTIERLDLVAATGSPPVARLGTLIGRTAAPADRLATATATLVKEGRRRLAVVDESGLLLGLLCLKKDGSGYCTDEGIRARTA